MKKVLMGTMIAASLFGSGLLQSTAVFASETATPQSEQTQKSNQETTFTNQDAGYLENEPHAPNQLPTPKLSRNSTPSTRALTKYYQNLVDEYQKKIDTLTWSITMNRNTIDYWTSMLEYTFIEGHALYGQQAYCFEAIRNNEEPMIRRIAERAQFEALKDNAQKQANKYAQM